MKKQLLNESEVRAFMKFANIEPLAGNFIEKLNEKAETTPIVEQDDEELEAEEPMDDMGGMEASGEEELEDVEMVDDEAEEAGGNEEAVIAGVKQTIDGLKTTFDAAGLGHLSDLFEVQDAGAPESPEEGPAVAVDGPEPPAVDAGMPPTEDEVVSEVARRVARRLASLQRG